MTKLPAENNARLAKNISMKLDNYFHITNTNNVQVSKRIYIEIPEEITNQLNLNHQPFTASHSTSRQFHFQWGKNEYAGVFWIVMYVSLELVDES